MNLDKLKQARKIFAEDNSVSFDMSDFGYVRLDQNNHPCGTAGCIAGTVAFALQPEEERIYYAYCCQDANYSESTLKDFCNFLEATDAEARDISLPTYDFICETGFNKNWCNWTKNEALEWLDWWIAKYEKELKNESR